MAEWKTPYRFSVYGVDFDVTFYEIFTQLEYVSEKHFDITLAFARKVGEPKTLAVKTILNPKDHYNYMKGQKVAFQSLINTVWANWGMKKVGYRKDFSANAWGCSFCAGMWED